MCVNLRNMFAASTVVAAAMTLSAVAVAQDGPIRSGVKRVAEGAREAVDRVDPRRITANRPVDGAAAPQNTDQFIAQCLEIGNEEEVSLGTLAAGKTQNPQVKQFAEMIAKDHGDFAAKLKKFGAKPVDLAAVHGSHYSNDTERAAAERRTARAGDKERARADREGADGEQTTAHQNAGRPIDFVDVKVQMAQRCLQHARQCWNDKPQAEANMGFLGSQLVLHQQMIDAQEVLREYASPELQSVIDQGIQTSQSHLARAQQLIDELSPKAAENLKQRRES